ncbi:MAG: hypothetical protein EOO04_00030 [Chitinophagaceae bacterium]|nr:MAG: hypothetical protein EOO04_00030 [Chitinophagaceae bacterium]
MPNKLTTAASAKLLSPSSEYKREASKAMMAIAAFIIVYILLFLLSLGLVALCVAAAIWLIAAYTGWITLLLGIGIIGSGVMVLVFITKFLFATSKTDETDSIEITAKQHPRLFQSIRSLAEQIGTPMPKKVLISPDVNAAVFYNSSFWSMFLPVRKNLKIGLGLINGVNISEFEAVVAHELGHFSQRSMKVGSWVYQMNRIIHDMLFNNTRFNEGLSNLVNVHGIFQLAGLLAIKFIQGIQWVLQQMYGVINKSYLGLSRQMEFHADLVAASVCGSNNVINALRRIQYAGECYDATLQFCNKSLQNKRMVADIYAAQSFVSQIVATQRHLKFEGGLPVPGENNDSRASRIAYKDQWSSHPTLPERQYHLERFDLISDVDSSPAWELLDDSNSLKTDLTELVYQGVPKDELKDALNADTLKEMVEDELERELLAPIFKGYYDQRLITEFDLTGWPSDRRVKVSFDELLNESSIALPKKLNVLQQDMMTLQAISLGYIDTTSFDFDGQRYKTKEAASILERLQEEVKQCQDALKVHDQEIFRYFYETASEEGDALKAAYLGYFELQKVSKVFQTTVEAMMSPLEPIFNGETVPLETIQTLIRTHKETHEPAIKSKLREWQEAFSAIAGLQEKVEKFLHSDYQYFHHQGFFDNEMQELQELVNHVDAAVASHIWQQLKKITEMQAKIAMKVRPEQVIPV